MVVGETAYVSYSDIEVDPSGRAYVQTKTKLTEASPNWNIVRVRREADGFVVWLRKDTCEHDLMNFRYEGLPERGLVSAPSEAERSYLPPRAPGGGAPAKPARRFSSAA